MKSRVTTVLLAVLVAVVWGAIAWKILAPAAPTDPGVPARPATAAQPATRADSLCCDYPDPFLRGGSIQPVATARPAAVQTISRPKPPKAERPLRLSCRGHVRAGRQTLYLLDIEGRACELYLNDTVGGFRLAAVDRDSLYLVRGGRRHGVSIE